EHDGEVAGHDGEEEQAERLRHLWHRRTDCRRRSPLQQRRRRPHPTGAMKRFSSSPLVRLAAAALAAPLLLAGGVSSAAAWGPAPPGFVCDAQSGGTVQPVPPLASVATVRA